MTTADRTLLTWMRALGATVAITTAFATTAHAEPRVFHRCGQVSMIAADSEVVYGVTRGTKVVRFSRTDSTTSTIAVAAKPVALAIDETSVYWLERPKDGWIGVRSVAKTGGDDVALAKLDEATALAVRGETVFVRSGPNLIAVPKTGGKPTVLVHAIKDLVGTIAVDDSSIYWVDNGAIWRASIHGDQPEILVPDHTTETPPIVDTDHIYWAEAGKVFAAPLHGRMKVRELARANDEIAAIAQDDTHLYWIAQNDRTAVDDVRRVVKRGGAVETVALGVLGNSAGPMNELVVDASGVTVATLDGRLITVPKHAPGKAKRPALAPDVCE